MPIIVVFQIVDYSGGRTLEDLIKYIEQQVSGKVDEDSDDEEDDEDNTDSDDEGEGQEEEEPEVPKDEPEVPKDEL